MPVDLADVQGLVYSAYRRLPRARYVLVRFRDQPEACRTWLGVLLESGLIDSALPKDVGHAVSGARVNVALTYSGLERLGLCRAGLDSFPTAFVEGLGRVWPNGEADHRSRILGDLRGSAPDTWTWGYQADPQRRVDAVVMIFAVDADAADAAQRATCESPQARRAIEANPRLLTGAFPDDPGQPVTEPFGFADGISQPVLKSSRRQLRLGSRRTQPPIHEIEDGEILLGHRDGAGQLPMTPTVPAADDPRRVLPDAKTDGFNTPPGQGRRDLGKNGTYLVFRQLEQNVKAFEDHCRDESGRLAIPVDHYKALLVGRWQNGSPLVTSPVGPDPAMATAPEGNDFGYEDDPFGARCPIGAHIRRVNPRDSLVAEDPVRSWQISNRHRILRRGRAYGLAIATQPAAGDGSVRPRGAAPEQDVDADGPKGLHFLCLNADIVRQFEFIQQNWVNDPTFKGLHDEVDPLIGCSTGGAGAGSMAVPPPPDGSLPRQTALKNYVTVRGGGYFFLPSLTALRYLADLEPTDREAEERRPAPRAATFTDALRLLMHGRFSFGLAGLLAVAPFALFLDNPGLLALLAPMFRVDTHWQLTVLTTAMSLTAAVAMLTWRTVQLHAPARFGLHTGWSTTLTWRRVARWQALSVPWVATTLWLSFRDFAGHGAPRPLRTWLLAALAGYAATFLLMVVAERLRRRWVRDTNPEHTVLLPPTLAQRIERARPSRRATPTAGESRPTIVGTNASASVVETFVAKVPADRGRGYIDHETGRILPGHLTGVLLVTVAAVLLLVVRLVYHPSRLWFGPQLPPAFYLLVALSLTTFAAAGAAFWLDRYRVPLLALIVAWTAIAGTFRDGDHRFRLSLDGADHPRPLPEEPGPTAALTAADRLLGQGERRPVIVVAAGGGGAYQAAWVARVLTGLTEQWGDGFSRSLRLVSATSGGAVGAMHYVNRYRPAGLSGVNLRGVVDAAAAPATGDVWWGLTFFDLPRALPFRIERDRGWALEQAWERALKPVPTLRTVGDWQRGVAAGWRPATAFNAMAVETGARVVLATYQLPDALSAQSLGDVTGRRDVDVATAARMSASFPFVTPFARAATDEVHAHVTDGGYWDNHGIVTALEWLEATRDAVGHRPILLVRIPPPPVAASEPRDRGWPWQLTAPVAGFEAMRTNAQRVRGDRDVEAFVRDRAQGPVVIVDFPAGGTPTLSWHVSRAERAAIDCAWQQTGAWKIMLIERALGSMVKPWPLASECRS